MTHPAPTASPLQLEVFTSPYRVIGDDPKRTFSPVTSTLVYGEREAVLIDAQYFAEDVDALGDRIEAAGRTLTTIYITHGHADHWFGIDRLIARFPSARAVATAEVVEYLAAQRERETATFRGMFGDDLVVPTSLPTVLDRDVIVLEGAELRVVKVGQGDIPSSTVLHIPALNAVIAGDVAYNGIHQMLGLGGPAEWRAWLKSVDKIAALQPETVVAGHKRPGADDAAAPVLAGTRAYIRDFAEAAAASTDSRELVATMRAKYPDHGNLTTLFFSAAAAIKQKAAAGASV